MYYIIILTQSDNRSENNVFVFPLNVKFLKYSQIVPPGAPGLAYVMLPRHTISREMLFSPWTHSYGYQTRITLITVCMSGIQASVVWLWSGAPQTQTAQAL